MRNLYIRVERVLNAHPCASSGEADSHALGEVRAVVRTCCKVTPDGSDHTESRRDRRENVLEIPAAGPPELVSVRMEDPIGTETSRGKTCHLVDPLACDKALVVTANEVEMTTALVLLEHLTRAIN